MKLTQARFPNQELPPGTPLMYLAEWEEMVHRFGLPEFREALQLVLRDRERRPFFPAPEEIEERILAKARSKRNQATAQSFLGDLAAWREQWERERAEDRSAQLMAQQNPAA